MCALLVQCSITNIETEKVLSQVVNAAKQSYGHC